MKVLVLAGQASQGALLQEFKHRGFTTVLADWGANPVAKAYADVFYQASTLDIPAIKEIAQKENVDYIITACTDQALLTVAKVSEDLGLPCYIDYQTALNVTNKQYMKKVFTQYDISSSRHVIFGEGELSEASVAGMRYPMVVKPVDCNSSKGVKKAYNFAELEEAFNAAWNMSRTKTAIIEEFVQGDELSVEVWVTDGKAEVLCVESLAKVAMDDRFVICGEKFPAAVSDCVQEKIRETAQKIADAFGLKNSPMLIQMICDGKDVFVLEFSARTGGGKKYRIVPAACGVDIIKALTDLTLGIKPDVQKKAPANKHQLVAYFYSYPGVFDHIDGFEELKQTGVITEYEITAEKGEELEGKVESSGNRVGGITLVGDDLQTLREKYQKAVEAMHILDAQGNDLLRHDILRDIIL